jgi:hypothetical protein
MQIQEYIKFDAIGLADLIKKKKFMLKKSLTLR